MSGTPYRIELKNVTQSFQNNDEYITLFENVDLTIEQGTSYAITGPSGSGKSSLLMLLSGLEHPSIGVALGDKGDAHFPLQNVRQEIGFIFQQFHLLPELNALHNVALPLRLRGQKNAEAKAKNWLEKLGLGHRLYHLPQQLSGGEQQRTAIARALVYEPKFIFADEPTGNLDSQCAKDIADILFQCCHDHGAGLVLVTHCETLAGRAMQHLRLKDGEILKNIEASEELYYA